jgi:predicted transcriptional regulator
MSSPPPERRSPGELEQAVYAAVSAGGEQGVTAAQVIADVDRSLAYTTVVTTLGRLVTRGVLSHRRAGRTVHYAVVGDSGTVVATSTARRMHRLLESAPDRDGALVQFVAGLSPDDEARLVRLLAEAEDSPS